jgi:hypothetical protein
VLVLGFIIERVERRRIAGKAPQDNEEP